MKPRLLFISHVNPAHPRSGQQQRVYYSLKAAKRFFQITFLTLSSGNPEDLEQLRELCDDVIALPPLLLDYRTKLVYALQYICFALRTGLKKSNFIIGEVEFSPKRLESVLKDRNFDYVIFEYWYAYKSVSLFQSHGMSCILDMHDTLWKAFEQQIKTKPFPLFYKERIKRLYRQYEQHAWKSFDRIIALNKIEQNMVKGVISTNVMVDFLPMGIDLSVWEYLWIYNDSAPYRVGFYGSLSSKVNIDSALRCLEKIMPIIWEKKPGAEFWLIGNHPADALLQRAKTDSRIKITGYVEKVQKVIAKMGVILCPWEGVFGFRSRIIEVMAIGVPLVVSYDAIAGMGIAEGGIEVGRTNDELANHVLGLLDNKGLACQLSLNARSDVEKNYSFEDTYLKYFNRLQKRIDERSKND